MTKDFLKDMLKYLPAQIVPAIVGFISIPIVTRLFLPQDYGHYSLVMATVGILSSLLSWLPMSIVRFYPAYERDNSLDIFYGNITKFGGISILIVTAFSCFILFSAKTRLPADLYPLMLIGLGVAIVTSILNTFQYLLRSQRQIRWFSGSAIWRSILGLGLGLGLVILFDFGIEGLLWGIIISIVAILPLLWRRTFGSVSILRSQINFPLLKGMARYSFPLVAGNLAAWILSLSDRYILEYFRGSNEVGIYSASYNIAERTIFLLVALISLSSGPISMHIWEKEGEAKTKEFIAKIIRYYFMLCLPAVIGLSALAKPFISILTGQQYFEGYRIIPFITSGILFLGLQQKFQGGFLFYKKTGFITLSVVSSGLLNLFLNLLFIPKYGYMAAALTTLISYAFLLFLMIIGSRRFFVWEFPFKSLARVSCASIIMGLAVYYIVNRLIFSTLLNLIICVAIGVLIYLLLLCLFREFQIEEKDAIKRILIKYLPGRLIPSSWAVQK